MALYHASIRQYAPGEVVAARERELSVERARAEARLARYAPPELVPRTRAVYASDSAAFVAAYLSREHPHSGHKYVYRVTTDRWTRHPMALVAEVARAGAEEHVALIAREYWTPTRNWRCWEYLCPDLKVVVEEEWPDMGDRAGAQYQYGLDRDQAARLRVR